MRRVLFLWVMAGCLVILNTTHAAVLIIDDGTVQLRGNQANQSYGYDFTLGSSDLTVTALGVWDDADGDVVSTTNGETGGTPDGLVGTVTVRLWDHTSTSSPLATVVISGTEGYLSGEFRFKEIASPVALNAGGTYQLTANYTSTDDILHHYLAPADFTACPDVHSFVARYCKNGNQDNFADGYGGGSLATATDKAFIGPNLQYGPMPYDGYEVQTFGTTSIDATLYWKAAWDPEGVYSVHPDIVDQYVFMTDGSTTDPNLYYIGATGADPGTSDPDSQFGPIQNLGFETSYQWAVVEAMDGHTQTLTPNVSTIDDVDPNNIVGPQWAFTTKSAAPTIDTPPADVLADQLSDPSFTCIIECLTALTAGNISWDKDGTSVTAGISFTDNGDNTYTSVLSLTDVDALDEGVYTCTVTNTAGSDEASAKLMTKRLAGHWKMDESLSDSSGNGWAGTYTTSPVVYDNAGKDGKALSLLNEPNYVQISGSEDAFNFFDLGLTVSCWVKTVNNRGGLVCKQDRDGYDTWNGFLLYINNSVVNLNYRGVGGPVGGMAVNDGQWHMVTGTFDRDTGEMLVYVDGEEDAAATYPNATIRLADNPLVIGAEQITGTMAFEGLIDDVRVYTYAKTDTEVLDLYNEFTDPDKQLCLLDYADGVDVSGPEGEPDCKVDLYDFAEIAVGWLTSGLYPNP